MSASPDSRPHFTEPTTNYWQAIVGPDALRGEQLVPPWRYAYPATLPSGRFLMLPIRPLESDPLQAVASLICNQASFSVVEHLGAMLATELELLEPDVVVGLPTLGLTLAAATARHLRHDRYVPMGYSRKFWYEDGLSAAVQSVTSPQPGKRVYLDPNQLPLIAERRVALVDDAISTGRTMNACWDLLESLGAEIVACGVAMRQGDRWRELLDEERVGKLVGVFDSPLLRAVPEGWEPVDHEAP
ncbi:MAG: hypothetical protein JJU06_04750 [Ectothiorhodospiraceae bacterium]|nr:hypothetical protein [Ectothiorhodospiraceae bacterium]